MKTFSIDGQQMAYHDYGQGPVVVFGHSYLWDSQMWQPQIEMLSQSYRCIVPDFWAHGLSQAAPYNMANLRDYAAHILALMDYLGVETFSIVGLSMGGMWGAEVVSLAPKRVESLVLMDTFLGLEPEVTNRKYFAMLETISLSQMVPQQLIDTVGPIFFAKNVRQDNPHLIELFERRLATVKGQDAVEIARVGRMVFGRRDMIDEIETFHLPVLIAVGQDDIPRPVLESYLMHDCIEGSQLVEIPSAGHIANLEQPEYVTRTLQSFLEKIRR